MMTTFATAWRTVTKRMAADWLIVGAVFVTVALATALLAAGPIYADAVTISALQRSLSDAPVTTANVLAEVRVLPADLEAADRATRRVLDDALSTTGAGVYQHLSSDAFGLDDGSDTAVTNLASFQHFDKLLNSFCTSLCFFGGLDSE